MIDARRLNRCAYPVAVVLAVYPVPVSATGPKEPPPARQASVALDQINRLGVEIKRLGDWGVQADLIDSYIDDLWDRNGWANDTDVFVRRMAHEIARIPPWRFQQRMRTLSGMIADRYELTASQRARFESTLFRETFGLFFRNAEVIARQTREFVSARVDGRPFTPEQVARWTNESEPLMVDIDKGIERILRSMEQDMTDGQRELLRHDVENMNRRSRFVIEQRARWRDGGWKPEDWGLQNDPIQNGQAAAGPRARGATGAAARPVSTAGANPPTGRRAARKDQPPRPGNESTWARFVRRFVNEHALDAGQRTAIYSILAELESRAKQYRQTHAKQLAAIPPSERATHEALEPIRAMFEELKARSEALLTNAQRQAGK